MCFAALCFRYGRTGTHYQFCEMFCYAGASVHELPYVLDLDYQKKLEAGSGYSKCIIELASRRISSLCANKVTRSVPSTKWPRSACASETSLAKTSQPNGTF